MINEVDKNMKSVADSIQLILILQQRVAMTCRGYVWVWACTYL